MRIFVPVETVVGDHVRPETGDPRYLLPHERLARRICKLASAKPRTHEELKSGLKKVLLGATGLLNRETGMQHYEEALGLAFDQGWIREHEGRLGVMDAGALFALRSRSASRRPRSMSRLR